MNDSRPRIADPRERGVLERDKPSTEPRIISNIQSADVPETPYNSDKWMAEVTFWSFVRNSGSIKEVFKTPFDKLLESSTIEITQENWTVDFREQLGRTIKEMNWLADRFPEVSQYFESAINTPQSTPHDVNKLQAARTEILESLQGEILRLTPQAFALATSMWGGSFISQTTLHVKPFSVRFAPSPLSNFGTGDAAIVPYKEAQKITKGHAGAIQGHHLAEVRHLERLGYDSSLAPTVVLSRLEHTMITNVLSRLMPTGQEYTKAQILHFYSIAYVNKPTWLAAIRNFLN
jgi:hypothetical protein